MLVIASTLSFVSSETTTEATSRATECVGGPPYEWYQCNIKRGDCGANGILMYPSQSEMSIGMLQVTEILSTFAPKIGILILRPMSVI